MITLTTTTSNADAPLRIYDGPSTSIGTINLRVSRSATLDGNAVITHLGYSAGDRIMNIECLDMTDDERNTLRDWVQTETQFILSCREGCFLGAISDLRIDKDPVRFTFIAESAEVEL